MFDLLSTVEYGGCSAKLNAKALAEALAVLPKMKHKDLLVDIETHDDAGVYKINETTALIQTVDFFPPVCSDPYEFGKIAAANALSDVYAMGGDVLTAMNIVMFPSSKIPLIVLTEILKGGQEKVTEAGGVIVGGHTIDDYPPKYGLAVSGIVDPSRIITNAKAAAGDLLILTKPLGTGIIIAGKRLNNVTLHTYEAALRTMQLLNKNGASIMQKYNVKSATDITGFGLLGHALKMAQASGVTFRINAKACPVINEAIQLVDTGVIPGACFRNQEFAGENIQFSPRISYAQKMVLYDAQTSGGLFMSVPRNKAIAILDELKNGGYPDSAIIGEVLNKKQATIEVI